MPAAAGVGCLKLARYRVALGAGALLGLMACPTPTVPGDEVLGSFGLRADLLERNCQVENVFGAGFDFEMTFSHDRGGSAAWATIAGYTRDASWDGQVLGTTATAARVFDACTGCQTLLVETIEVALLSRSQAMAVGSTCPDSALDGGTPRPDPDAGITPPATTKDGFDSALACGELKTQLVSTETTPGSCPQVCRVCTSRFRLSGSRR